MERVKGKGKGKEKERELDAISNRKRALSSVTKSLSKVSDVVCLYNHVLAEISKIESNERKIELRRIADTLKYLMREVCSLFTIDDQTVDVKDFTTMGIIQDDELFKTAITKLLQTFDKATWEIMPILQGLAFVIDQQTKSNRLNSLNIDQLETLLGLCGRLLESIDNASLMSTQLERLDTIIPLLEGILAVDSKEKVSNELLTDLARKLNKVAKQNKHKNHILYFKALYAAQAMLHIDENSLHEQFKKRRGLYLIKGLCHLGLAGANLGVAAGAGFAPASFGAAINIMAAVENLQKVRPDPTLEKAQWFSGITELQDRVAKIITNTPQDLTDYHDDFNEIQEAIKKSPYAAMAVMNTIVTLIANANYFDFALAQSKNHQINIDIKVTFSIIKTCFRSEINDEFETQMHFMQSLYYLLNIECSFSQNVLEGVENLLKEEQTLKPLMKSTFVSSEKSHIKNQLRQLTDVLLFIAAISKNENVHKQILICFKHYLSQSLHIQKELVKVSKSIRLKTPIPPRADGSSEIQAYVYHRLTKMSKELPKPIKAFYKRFCKQESNSHLIENLKGRINDNQNVIKVSFIGEKSFLPENTLVIEQLVPSKLVAKAWNNFKVSSAFEEQIAILLEHNKFIIKLYEQISNPGERDDLTAPSSSKDKKKISTSLNASPLLKRGFFASKFLIGSSDFRQVRENKYRYIDKSLFIKAVLDDPDMIKYIVRPRRFGKTMNLRMLKTFIECPTEPLEKEKTKLLFQGLNIAEENYKAYWDTYFAKYPVIDLSFGHLDGSSLEKLESSFRDLMRNAYEEHSIVQEYLSKPTENLKKQQADKRRYKDMLGDKDLKRVDLYRSLSSLINLVKQHYGIAPYLLIDEFDKPYHDGRECKCLKDIERFMLNALKPALKDNGLLGKAVLMGVFSVSVDNKPSGLNNMVTSGQEDPQYARYFGFTREEIAKELLYGEDQSVLKKMEKYYGGYNMGVGSVYVFNPWSALNMLTKNNRGDKPFELYWHQRSQYQSVIKSLILKMNEEAQEVILNLYNGTIQSVLCNDQKIINLHDIDTFERNQSDVSIVWNLMFFYGYLTIEKRIDNGRFALSIPNEEARCFLNEVINELQFSRKQPGMDEGTSSGSSYQ